MKNTKQITLAKFTSVIFVAFLMIAGSVQTSHAQFSQTVVLLKGTVRNAGNGQPMSVKVSIRSAADTSIEVTASNSNAASGNYLVILKPASKYIVRLEGDAIQSQVAEIETPAGTSAVHMSQDFTVMPREMGANATDASTLTAMNTVVAK
jgi:hypothetical protein